MLRSRGRVVKATDSQTEGKNGRGSNPTLDSLVVVSNTSPGRPEPCEGNLVAAAIGCGGLMVKHPWPLLAISFSDFRKRATLNMITCLPTYLPTYVCLRMPVHKFKVLLLSWSCDNSDERNF